MPTAVQGLTNEQEWQAMLTLKNSFGARFIFNLPTNFNLWRTYGKPLMAKARAVLGDAVIGFELGNEPNACECHSCHTFTLGILSI